MPEEKKKKTLREYLEGLAGIGKVNEALGPTAAEMRKKQGAGLWMGDIGEEEEDKKKKKKGMSYNK